MSTTNNEAISQPGAGSSGVTFLIGLLVTLIILMGLVFGYAALQAKHDKEYISLAGEQRLLSQRMVKYASEASSADVEAFARLKESRDRFAQTLGYLQKGSAETGLPPSPAEAEEPLAQLAGRWTEFGGNADSILKGEATIRMLSEFVRAITSAMPAVLAASDEAVSQMINAGADPRQIHTASRQLMLGQRISFNINRVLQGGLGAAGAAQAFDEDVRQFAKVLEAMLDGDRELKIERVADAQARKKLQEVVQLFRTVKELSSRILERTPELFKAQIAASKMFADSEALLDEATALTQAYAALSESPKRRLLSTAGIALGVAALLLLFWLGIKLVREARQRLEVTTRQHQQNQAAIRRLISEIGSLADGDLTVNATIAEDITGTIAERINFAIVALRNLVTTINETAVQVSSAAAETQATALHLAEAADHQAHQISSAVAATNEMASSIEQVSGHAAESAEVAKQSVSIANKGAGAVQNTIRGMDTIREQIQETSKRIKRLGESSQEIGEIVELINDLTDQTNILALNAAIQAAMAGEAGRGFAVVADEVQRLAERSTDATKQIEALVKTIQSDTSEAIGSMEKSTAEVVNGTQLARAAGEDLVQIENVSTHLAELIQGISDAAQQQAGAAANISETMNVIQDLTTQTAAGTTETAASISNLTDLSNELRESVSGFKLPR